MKRTFSLPTIYIDRLQAEKEATGQNLSEILRRAIDAYLDKIPARSQNIILEFKKGD